MIEILTSGVALGVHVPGLLLADRLRERGVEAGISVLERLLPPLKLAATVTMKQAFHRNFRVAKAGQRMAANPADSADATAVAGLFEDWRRRKVDHVVVFSGFWLPLVERYASATGCEVDVCHVDSVRSPSFTKVGTVDLDTHEIWLADADRGEILCSIPVARRSPVPWADRARLLLHGGGWGMGTYRDCFGELLERQFELDVIAYEPSDVTSAGIRYFMLSPDWHPWHDDGYPPIGEFRPGSPTVFTRGCGHHGSFDLTRTAAGTISKPGGGTLLDSLWSATPAVLLEAFGAHEQRNARLWEELGFAISWSDWRRTGFDVDALEPLHRALLEATTQLPDYSRMLADRVIR